MTPPRRKFRPLRRESAQKRRLRLWREGTCLMNRQWYLKRCAQHGHDPKPTVWDNYLPAGTL